MNDDHWLNESPTEIPQPSPPAPSRLSVWLERIAIGVVATIAIFVPLMIGLLFYLAMTDGIVVNANDPFYETRMWLIQERMGATGIGLTVTSPRAGISATRCATTSATFLKWDRRLRIETDARYCRCYEEKNSQLVETSATTCQP